MKKTVTFSGEEAASIINRKTSMEKYLPAIADLNKIGTHFSEIIFALREIDSLFSTGIARSIPIEGVTLSEEKLKKFQVALATITNRHSDIIFLENTMPFIIKELKKILETCHEI